MNTNKESIAIKCGLRCRQIRMTKGMSQEELADMMHVTPAAISKWEKSGISNIDTITELSNCLGQDITADQLDQEGAVGEVGKEILSKIVSSNGYIDFNHLCQSLYGMKEDRICNEIFKLERIGTVFREQYKDFVGKKRDGLFITAKGVITYKNVCKNSKIPSDVLTYDSFINDEIYSFQDFINSDKVTSLLANINIKSMSFRCDYIHFLYKDYDMQIIVKKEIGKQSIYYAPASIHMKHIVLNELHDLAVRESDKELIQYSCISIRNIEDALSETSGNAIYTLEEGSHK